MALARWLYAPTGRKGIAQGKAKRRPGIRYATKVAIPERAERTHGETNARCTHNGRAVGDISTRWTCSADMEGVIRSIPWFQGNHTVSSNPTAPTGVDRYQTEPCKTPVFRRLSRLEKRLDLGSATRNATPRSAMHRVAWALQPAKGTSPKCEKPYENQGF
jgi:hypothetical protein